MCFAVNPPGDAIIAIRYVADCPAVSLAALVALPVLQAIDRSVDAIGIIVIDLVFGNFVAKSILEHMGSLPRTDDPRQAIIVVVMVTIVAGIPATCSNISAPTLGIGRTTCDEARAQHNDTPNPAHNRS
ncbi:MAG: hypothetical protein WC729_08515 [Sphingomonas sp.]|jgi:hypothetical protein|uniref:hypothetical protein n=1 Tax=Sphingomonas sp. TaxID=28214 RepID=UPI00356821AC